ncbi:restriction endonuclease [Mycobacterium sp.]|jgi:predicted helicase|uniref:restriction endonuclease n=1 Tax=Mycobacterium sp. TaxID=1785 RepID=UPI003F95923D
MTTAEMLGLRIRHQQSYSNEGKWSILTTALTALINQLPEDPKARGDRFEELCLWFFRNDPYWRQSFERVDSRAKSPYRHMKADKGTDLIAKHIDGTLYAIQCKAYPNSSVTMHGMSQFKNGHAIFHSAMIAPTVGPGSNKLGAQIADSWRTHSDA